MFQGASCSFNKAVGPIGLPPVTTRCNSSGVGPYSSRLIRFNAHRLFDEIGVTINLKNCLPLPFVAFHVYPLMAPELSGASGPAAFVAERTWYCCTAGYGVHVALLWVLVTVTPLSTGGGVCA